jgi:hypothetical protein
MGRVRVARRRLTVERRERVEAGHSHQFAQTGFNARLLQQGAEPPALMGLMIEEVRQ